MIDCKAFLMSKVSIPKLTSFNALSAAYLSASGAVDNHWIGLNDMSREGGFIWSDGSAVAYVNWDDGEPNNSGEEDCGLILAGKGGVWNDAKCDDRHKVGYFILSI